MPTFRDSWGITRDNIEDFAIFRATSKSPRLGGALCPAVEFTFAVADENGQWRNPTCEERKRLRELVITSGHCCQHEGDRCPLRNQPGPDEAPDTVMSTNEITDPWNDVGNQAIDDWEAGGYEDDWWGTYDSHVGEVDIHIDLMPDENGATRRTMTIYAVEWQGDRGRTRTDRILDRAPIDFDPI